MARSKVRVKVNNPGVQEYLDGNHGVREMLAERAARVLAKAQEIAPVVTGNYRDGLEVTEAHTDRLVMRVRSTAPHAHLVEAKAGILAKALDEAR